MSTALLALALACPTALASVQSSPTLLVDNNTSTDLPDPNGQAQVESAALGRIWIQGKGLGEDLPVFTYDASGAPPVPFGLPFNSVTGDPYDGFSGAFDLGSGRAVLAVRTPALQDLRALGTDGTTAGTEELGVGFYNTPSVLSDPAAPGIGVFVGVGADDLPGLYRTDGTAAGTVLLEHATPRGAIALLGNLVIYSVEEDLEVTQIRAQPVAGGPSQPLVSAIGPQPLFGPRAVNGTVLFSYRDQTLPGGTGIELWSTDGTPGGTGLLADLTPGSGGSSPVLLGSNGSLAYLSAATFNEGRELWTSDGTAAGTKLVSDLTPGPGSSLAASPPSAQIGNGLVFRRTTDASGSEVWFASGPSGPTFLIAELGPGSSGSAPKDFVSAAGRVFFTASQSGTGREPFSTDGFTITPLGNLAPGSSDSGASGFTEFDGRVWFSADLGGQDFEPLSVEPQGTGLVVEVEIGAPADNGDSLTPGFVSAGDIGYVWAYKVVQGLGISTVYSTDGTPAGTTPLIEAQGFIEHLGALDDGALFRYAAPAGGLQLALTNGAVGGEIELDLVSGGVVQTVRELRYVGQLGPRAVLVVRTDEQGRELWQTDGTPAGTGLLDLEPGPADGLDVSLDIAIAGERFYFTRRQPSGDWTLWTSDGSPAGTNEVLPGVLGNLDVQTLTAVGDQLVFSVETGPLQSSLWKTDGTDAGTQPILALPQGAVRRLVGLDDRALVRLENLLTAVDEETLFSVGLDGTLETLSQTAGSAITLIPDVGPFGSFGTYFAIYQASLAEDGTYFTDGTAAGTVRITTEPTDVSLIASGAEALQALPVVGQGTELWITDGTPTGTAPLLDVAPGALSSAPEFVGQVGNRMLFTALTQEHGRELHVIPLPETGAFSSKPIGQGCGALGFSDLTVEGAVRLGRPVTFKIDEVAPLAPVLLYVSTGIEATPLGDCTVYLSAPVEFGLLQANATGEVGLVLEIPDLAPLVGVELYFQAAAITPGGPALGAVELTNAVETVIAP